VDVREVQQMWDERDGLAGNESSAHNRLRNLIDHKDADGDDGEDPARMAQV
jgi:hypothetical protein